MKKIFQISKDTLYISKLTNVEKKKRIILMSVALSQIIAFVDILMILVFTSILTGDLDALGNFETLTPILELKFFLPLLILFRYFIQYYQSVLIKDLQLRIGNSLKEHIFSSIFEKQNLSIADSYFYINTLAGHVAFFYSSISTFLNFLLQSIAFSIYLVISNPSDIGIFTFVIILLLKPITVFLKKSRESMHESFIQGKAASYDIQRVVENLFLIKLLNKEKDELSRYIKRITSQRKYLLTNHKYGVINAALPSFITIFIMSVIVSSFSSNFNISIDFVAITIRMFQSIGSVTGSVNQIVNSHVHLEKFYELEKTNVSNNVPLLEKIIGNHSSNAIVLSKVNFKYQTSSNLIFKDLDLTFKKNTHTILTGPNGSGKSTLLGLLTGIYKPESGSIQTFSNKFAYVGPTPLIFTTSLKNNLTYGCKKEVEDKELLTYISMLNVFKDKEIIDLETDVNNKALSSGQMQKIAFIRALISNPDVLFLDESTSNLDTETKNTIFEILKNDSTTIINSTHDPASFKNVDSILKIEIREEYNKINKISEL
jgi:ATP-binding cassette, subfamily B, bacterial CvaB/MchF/RaxB